MILIKLVFKNQQKKILKESFINTGENTDMS